MVENKLLPMVPKKDSVDDFGVLTPRINSMIYNLSEADFPQGRCS